MKKVLIALFAFALGATATNAQEIFDNPDLNRKYFGVRASYELSVPGDINIPGSPLKSDIFDNGSGFSIEGIYNIPVWKNLYVQPGVGIYYNTYSVKRSVAETLLDMNVDNASARQWGIRVPVHVGYNFDFIPEVRISVFTGPELNISFKGNSHYSIDKYSVEGPLFGDEGDLNRTDIKWRFGVGATIATKYYVAISGAVGMCDLARDTEDGYTKTRYEMNTNIFDITLGYNF